MSTKKATTRKTSKPKKASSKKPAAKPAAPEAVAGTLRLPKVGEKITRTYRGKEHVVEVVDGGFRYNGDVHTSLTSVAKAITNYAAISGPAFFGLWKRTEAK